MMQTQTMQTPEKRRERTSLNAVLLLEGDKKETHPTCRVEKRAQAKRMRLVRTQQKPKGNARKEIRKMKKA